MPDWTPSERERLVILERDFAALIAGQARWMVANDKQQDDRHVENQTILKEIKTQTTLTNGRVSKLYDWRNMILGGWFVVMAIVAYLLKK